MYKLEVMTVYFDTATLRVIVLGIPDVQTKLLSSVPKNVLGAIVVLIDPRKDLRDSIDGNGDCISKHFYCVLVINDACP